jgi:protease-4
MWHASTLAKEADMRRALSLVGAVAAASIALVPALAQNTIGILEIKGAPKERPAELSWLLGSSEPTLRQLVGTIHDASVNDDLKAIVIRLKDAELNRTQVEELGQAITKARSSGKKVAVFSENMGATELLLGSYADRSLVQSGGAVTLPGLYMEEMYLADTLKWIGVKADMVQIGDYKGANEMFVNSAPSKAWDENLNQLLDGLYANMRTELKMGRNLDDLQLDQAMRAAWLAEADDAVKVGLVDAAVDLLDLAKAVSSDADAKWETLEPADGAGKLKMDEGNPFAAMSQMMSLISKKPPTKATEPTIAILHIDGEIVDGDSKSGGFSGGSSVGSRTIRNSLEDIRSQDLIKGVVLRIDSPGGSAIASEVMWQGIRRVAEKKPVWVSVGSMAASGGYYLAVAGDKIYVNPSSIVGSIGVVGGKFSMGGLYDMVKLHVTQHARGPMAAMFNSSQPWTPEQLALVRGKMKQTYDQFTKRVEAGRKGINLAETAEGRLFTGDKAIASKMADKVGSLDDTIHDLASSLKMDDYAVMDFPAPRPLNEVIGEMFKGFGVSSPVVSGASPGASAPLISTLRAIVGEKNWPTVSRSLDAMMVLRDEPVALTLPSAILIH